MIVQYLASSTVNKIVNKIIIAILMLICLSTLICCERTLPIYLLPANISLDNAVIKDTITIEIDSVFEKDNIVYDTVKIIR